MVDRSRSRGAAPGGEAPEDVASRDVDPPVDDLARDREPGDAGAVGPATWALLVVGAVAATLARWWLARSSVGLDVVADEAAYVATARLIAGDGSLNVGRAGTYSPGYGVFLAPVSRLVDDPLDAHRWAVAANVVLGVVTFGLLHVLARRLTALRPAACAAAAAVVAVLPALSVHARWLWAENLLAPAYLALLLAVVLLARRPGTPLALATVALAVGAYAVHSRMLVPAAVAVAAIGLLALRRELPWATGAGAGTLAVAGYVGVEALADAVDRRVYEPGGAVSQLDTWSAGGVTDVLVSTAGQTWYLLATTAALAGLGALVAARSLLPSRWRAPDAGAPEVDTATGLLLDRRAALALVAMTAAACGTSVLFIAGQPRADHLVYGRYVDTVVPPLLLLGIAALVATPGRRLLRDGAVVVAATVVAAVTVQATRADQLETAGLLQATIAGTVALHRGRRDLDLRHATAVAVAAAALVLATAALARGRDVPVLAVLAVLAVAAVALTAPRWPVSDDLRDRARDIAAVREVVPEGEVIRYRVDLDAPMGTFWKYGLVLDDRPLERQVPGGPVAPTPYSLAPTDAPLGEAGARIAHIDPWAGLALWVDPGPRQDELAADGRLLPAGFPASLPPEAIGTLEVLDPVHVDGDRLVGRVRTSGPGGGSPWPVDAVHRLGTARLAISLEGPGCPCPDLREDLRAQVDPDDPPVTVELDVDLPDGGLDPGRYEVALRWVQEGFGPLSERHVLPLEVPGG